LNSIHFVDGTLQITFPSTTHTIRNK